MTVYSRAKNENKLKNLLQNLSVSLGAIMISLLGVEIGLRLFWQNPANYAEATSESLFWRYDSLLGWTMLPNVAGKFIRPEFSAEIKTNSIGLRDDEIALKKTENECRILLLGDSVTAGFEVARSETYEALLESRLNRMQDGRSYQVINAGFRGYGTDQELLFLESRGLALRPDLVILAFVPANDLEDNVTAHTTGRIYAKPYFEYASDSSLVLRGVPVSDYPGEQMAYSNVVRDLIPASQEASHGRQNRIKKLVSDHFYLYGFLAQRMKSAGPAVVAFLKRCGVLQQSTPASFLEFYRTQLPQSWRRRWQVTFDLLLQIKKLCDGQKIPLVIWMFPLKEQVYERDLDILIDGYGLKSDDYDFEQPEEILRRFSEAHSIFFLPSLTRFREEAAKGKRMHFVSDNHFNPAGHALIADELFSFLLERRLLERYEDQAKKPPPLK